MLFRSSDAKYATALKASFLCNKYDLPPPILKTCRQAGLPFVVLPSLMNWLVIKKKMLNMSLYAYIYIYIIWLSIKFHISIHKVLKEFRCIGFELQY